MQLVNSCTEFDSYPDSKSIERSVPFLASGRIVVGWLEAFGSLLQARISDWLMALHAFLLSSVHGLAVQF